MDQQDNNREQATPPKPPAKAEPPKQPQEEPEKRPQLTGEKKRPPQQGDRKRPPQAAGRPRTRTQVGDAGYSPYKRANERKKKAQGNFFEQIKKRFQKKEKPANRQVAFGTNVPVPESVKQPQKKRKAPAVIYTEPKAFSRTKLIMQLVSVLSIVLAFVLGLSVFFRIKDVRVIGAEYYSAYAVEQASGINKGDNLLTFGRARATGQILAKLPYVKSARIGIKLPDTVKIEIEEESVVYAIEDIDGAWWLMDSDGKIVAQSSTVKAANYTQVLGVQLVSPKVGELAKPEDEQLGEETTETTVPLETKSSTSATSTTGRARLNAALEILKALEANDVVGSAASVDVSRLDDIVLWYGTQYQVNLGSINDTEHPMSYKIACMVDVILQMSDYQSGVLDISFTTWPDQVGFTPFA